MPILLDVLQFFDSSGEVMVYKLPDSPETTLVTGSQLIVQESQIAIFYKDGKALDKFQSGRYTLNTANLPLISSLIQIPFKGKNPFSAYVYFVSLKTFYNFGWGTPNPILFKDTFFRLINLRAHGSFSVRIENPEIFLNNMVGTKGNETTWAIENYLKKLLIEKITQAIGENIQTVLELAAKYSQISERAKNLVLDSFAQYGINLVDLVIESITPPEEVQKKINESSGLAAFDVNQYQQIAMADAVKEAAKNPGSTMGNMMGVGMGLGAGVGVGNMLGQQFGQMGIQTQHSNNQPNQPESVQIKAKCPKCHNPVEQEFFMCPICKQRLKKKCTQSACGKILEFSWDVCPFCGTEQ